MNYVILNGKKSTTVKGLLIQSLPPISKPLMRTEVEEIDGRDGDVVTRLGYSAYDKTMSIGLFGDYDIDEVISFFDSEGIVTFSNEADKFYKYQINAQIDFQRLVRFKTAKVTFHVQPFKFSAVDDAITFSINRLSVRSFDASGKGIDIDASDGVVTIKGTATNDVEFYVPINAMTLEAGSYTLSGLTDGTGAGAVKVRVIESTPTDADSLGGTFLQLDNDGEATLSATVTEQKTFHYLWVQVTAGTATDFTLDLRVDDLNVSSFTVHNRGNTTARPRVTVHGAGNVALSINGVQLFTLAIGNDGYITLDGVEMNAYKGTTLKNRSVTGNYASLVLKVGANVISWVGTVTKVEVENVSRWI